MIKTHRFNSTSDAYDASQTDDSISHGDVLVVESEHVVGVLVDAWPVAVTPERGAFHTFAPDVDVAAFGAEPERTLSYTVHPVDAEPYEHTETIAAKPARDLRPSVDVALAIADALWGESDTPEQQRIVPTGEPTTSPGDELVAAYPVGSRVAFEFEPDLDMPNGLVGEGTIAGVLEHVVDDGDGESGPHLSVWIVLALWHDGALYGVHPDDGGTRLRLVAPTE
jgi:hypothetical protein